MRRQPLCSNQTELAATVAATLIALASATSAGEPSWTLRFNFNDGAVGERVAGLDAAGGTRYTIEQSYEGGKAAALSALRGKENYGRWGGRVGFPTKLRKGDEIWWRVRTFWPKEMDYSANPRLKFLRVHTCTSSGEHRGYDDVYINATKGVSRGEDIWLSFPRYHDDRNIGFDHFQVYFTARMWWGGKDANVVAMLEEYCDLFYGPAGSKMKAFFDYCEANYQAMEDEFEPVEAVLAMFDEAKATVEPDSIYAKRLRLIDRFLNALRSKAEQLAQGRGPVAKLRTVWEANNIVIDGKLDDQYWVKHREWSVGRLRELQTGGQPIFGTTIMAGWDRHGQNLYFGILCEERPGEKLNVATTKDEDESIWYGDVVEIELDTDSHSYYQIAVNPAGAFVDLDRGADKSAWFRWESQAEVATQVAKDHWTVEIRIPVTQDENDPLNHVIGRKPSVSLPWHFNICRQRIRDNGSEHSAFSPTGTKTFHEPMKFAYFYEGRSHTFDVDETVTDFLIEASIAGKLMNSRKYDEALAAFVALSNREKATDDQKSHALAQAAACARRTRNFQQADELARQIPLEAIAKTARMENLLGERKWNAIIEQFGNEQFTTWPFTQIGAAAFARGRAYNGAKIGHKADADLRLALAFTSDSRIRMSILRTMGFNRERVLEDDDAALEAYREITGQTGNTGSAEYYYGVPK